MDHLKEPKGFIAEAAIALVRINPNTRRIVERMVDRVMPQVPESVYSERLGLSVVIVAAALGKDCTQLQSFVNWAIDDIEAALFTDGREASRNLLEVARSDLDLLGDLGSGRFEWVSQGYSDS